MYENLVNKARDLKRRSRSLRDKGDSESLDGGEGLLRNAIALLTVPWKTIMNTAPPSIPASQDFRDLAKELADCWGSLGGIQRRYAEALRQSQQSEEAQLRFDGAVQAYQEGLALEKDDRFRIANSYNLVQSVVLPLILSPERFFDAAFKSALQDVHKSIERQIATSRRNDPWAYSDRGLVELLLDDELKADQSWDEMDNLKPEQNVYTSGLLVLESISNSLPKFVPLHRAVERFRRKIKPK